MKIFVHQHETIEHRQNKKCEKKLARSRDPRFKLSTAETETLLAMYSDPTYTSSEVARRFGVCEASVTNAAKRAGLPLRERGRWRQAAPPIAIQDILLEAWTTTYESAASRCGVTKQYVGKLVDRWRNWALSQFGPRLVHVPKKPAPPRKPAPISPRAPSLHVVSFRVPTSVFGLLKQRCTNRPAGSSPNLVARSLMLKSLGRSDNALP